MKITPTNSDEIFPNVDDKGDEFDSEDELHRKIENDLKSFGLEMLGSEFKLEGKRIDTLAFDKNSKSFVILEYKKDRAKSAIIQALSYRYLLKKYRKEVIDNYNNHKNTNHKRNYFNDLDNPKIIIVARFFKDHHIQGMNEIKNIELWQVRKSGKNIMVYKINSENFAEYLKKTNFKTDKTIKHSDKLKKRPLKIQALYSDLESQMSEIGSFQIQHNKSHIAFSRNYRFLQVVVTEKYLKLLFRNKPVLLKILKEIDIQSKSYDRKRRYCHIDNPNDLKKIMQLVKKSYQIN